jgi:hypothetical protein
VKVADELNTTATVADNTTIKDKRLLLQICIFLTWFENKAPCPFAKGNKEQADEFWTLRLRLGDVEG